MPALAPSPGVLIATRALRGAFGALLIPQGFGLLKESFSEEEMPRVFAIFGPAMGLPMLAAPIMAGALIGANLWGTGWRLVFLINLPIGVCSFAVALRALPRVISHAGTRLDIGGMALVGLGLVAIIYPLIQGRAAGWPAWTFALLAAGLTLTPMVIGMAAARERARGRRARHDLLQPLPRARRRTRCTSSPGPASSRSRWRSRSSSGCRCGRGPRGEAQRTCIAMSTIVARTSRLMSVATSSTWRLTPLYSGLRAAPGIRAAP